MHPSEPALRGSGETPTHPSLLANPLDFISEDHLRERQICAVIDGLATADALDRRSTTAVLRFLNEGLNIRDMLHALMISIDEALARSATNASPVSRTEAVQAGSALGRTLALPVRSRSMAPAFDNAAMDGHAIDTSALTGTGPRDLRVSARVPAGQAMTTPGGREIAHFEDAAHSARVGLLCLADGLMFLPADAECLPAGALVEFQPFCQS